MKFFKYATNFMLVSVIAGFVLYTEVEFLSNTWGMVHPIVLLANLICTFLVAFILLFNLNEWLDDK